MANPFRLAFMGTPEFAVPCLRALIERPDLANIIAVYTQPDRPAGRGHKLAAPPIKLVAQECGIPVYQPEKINDPLEKRRFADLMVDVAIVVAYAQFLSPGILNTPRLGCINVHASLLPKYRGASPIQASILNDDKEAGVTTIRLIPEMDAGPMLVQKAIPITGDMTTRVLQQKLSELGAEVLIETLTQLQARTLVEKEQDESQVSFARLIHKENGRIQWNQKGRQIVCQVRAFDPWPGTFSVTSKGTLKIHKVRFHPDAEAVGAPKNANSGELFNGAGGLWVRCQDGWIELITVQPEGKKPMDIHSYLNGIKNISELNFT